MRISTMTLGTLVSCGDEMAREAALFLVRAAQSSDEAPASFLAKSFIEAIPEHEPDAAAFHVLASGYRTWREF